MLEARYTNDRIRKWCEDPEDEVNWAVHVFLGVWPTMAGALFINALSGKMVLEEICRRDG